MNSHRLSTITSADQILVLHAGKVAESGNHQELLERKGRYYNMWRKQIRAERAAEQAFHMAAKAQALKEAVMARPSSCGSPSESVSENEAGKPNSLTLVTSNTSPQVYFANYSRDSASDVNSGDDQALLKSPKGKRTTTKSSHVDEEEGNLADNDTK